ncbi:GNAT family N-acetyltransferase [Seonamhaeicola aphaedonensis]|uniref:Ribosomal protein S18 acetylase RimI-like enzyme n=1 Tax=Seonamhaeicola aphaedonensis TaxID=1461338 RepID=A0A3D9HM76_9FLAO|nr:GNAT family N-acetyltransferase [Seonamhaeicola aphaedonensis]RED50597.1 ribosomal protein S18 acetylase RimI-like enzyme [Seonamhaeicola aphaedonensis]
MTITALESIDDDVLNAFNNLIPQLSSSSPVPSKKDLETIINSGNTKLFVVKEGDTILGTLTLIFNKIPTGEKAWIEDVVVSENARGKGVGKLLTQFAVDYALEKGISKIDLTSSPERVAANKLYQKLGFQKRITNVYRYFNNK